jgi:site-specific DNA-adenine methylase
MSVHSEYIECFYGSGAVFRNKLPATKSVLIDLDPSVLPAMAPGIETICGDCLSYLAGRVYDGSELIYLDPPYLFSLRRSGDSGIYKHEFGTDDEHARLLDIILPMRTRVMISGYYSQLYASKLRRWRYKSWQSMTWQGPATEYLWMNFDEPLLLHDPRYVGSSFGERQRLRRLIGVEKRY